MGGVGGRRMSDINATRACASGEHRSNPNMLIRVLYMEAYMTTIADVKEIDNSHESPVQLMSVIVSNPHYLRS